MTYSPIVVFGFNRPDALRNTIASLLQNEEAKESDLFVFVDGPREGKVREKKKVREVREYVKSITGFKSLHYTFAENNKGLANSIIGGVSEVINQYGRVIILEDDIVLSNNFLSFLNQALVFYQNHNQVFSVCGESIRIKVPTDYTSDIYFAPRSGCWGWATWADRWNSVDWELKDWETVKRICVILINGVVLIVQECLKIGTWGKIALGLYVFVIRNLFKISYLYSLF